jgi:hypothetical protein
MDLRPTLSSPLLSLREADGLAQVNPGQLLARRAEVETHSRRCPRSRPHYLRTGRSAFTEMLRCEVPRMPKLPEDLLAWALRLTP